MSSPASEPPICTSSGRGARTVSLPVIEGHHAGNAWQPGHGKIKHSRVGKWRAWTLIAVHVFMAIHIVQWLITGLTVSPVEPSESMYTLRDGVVNAGFVFFALAILSTLVFGRFFCGWGCHIIAVQDLCGWVMMRAGIKPKPFRSRLLLLVPLGLALYMFVWPTVARLVLRPMLADAAGRLPAWVGQIVPIPGVRSEFIVRDFWATFAAWYIAIPFVLACGVFTVYFLGAKAFCTYGCPYGGFFAPADLLAPARIRVTDACEHCGHCTAVCTSNVRVHEEVRDFGMVVDPGCMKCLDCISVCPNDALYFGVGKPALFARPRAGAAETAAKAKATRAARYDLSWPEELIVGLLFLVLFWCYRAMFNQVPMLMAVAMGFVGAWACWKTWRLFVDPNSRIHGFQLKRAGKLRPWGVAFAIATVAWMVIAGWSGYIRWNLYRAQIGYASFQAPADVVLRPDYRPTAQDVATATVALEHYRKASPPEKDGSGGLGFLWPLRPDELVNVAYLKLITGDLAGSEAVSRDIIRVGHPKDALVFQLAQVIATRAERERTRMEILGAPAPELEKISQAGSAAVQAMFKDALARHDDLFGVRANLLGQRAMAGDKAGAMQEWLDVLNRYPKDIDAHLAAANFFAAGGDTAAAGATLDTALAQHKPRAEQLMTAAQIAARIGNKPRAIELATRAAKESLRLPMPRITAAQFLVGLGEPDKAKALIEEGMALAHRTPAQDGSTGAILAAGHTLNAMGKMDQGMPLIREAIARAGDNAWELVPMAMGLREVGSQMPSAEMLAESVRVFEKARDAEPKSTMIRQELATAYYLASKTEEAKREMRQAAELAPESAFLAERYSRLLEDLGDHNEASRWHEEARKRAAIGLPKAP